MNIRHTFLSLLFISFAACSVNHESKVSTLQQVKPSQAKSHKRRHNKAPQGVISVDIVNSNNRLHLLTGKHQQEGNSLWYQNSDNGGKSWSTAVKILNSNLAVKMVRGNDAQIAAQQNSIVVTWTKFVKNAPFNAGPMQAAYSKDNGATWQYTNTPPDWKKGPHGFADMAADKNAIHTVWLDNRNRNSSIKASQGLHHARSTDGGLSWQTNTTLDELTCSCCWNTIKIDFDGNPYVLYRDKQPSDLSIGTIKNQQWQRFNHVGAFNWQFEGCPHIGGGLDFQNTAGQKRIHAVVGTGHEKHLGIHYLYSDDAGKNWSNPTQLGNQSAIHADVASHSDGRVVTVWDMMGEDGLNIFVSESSDRGNNWSTPKKISTPGMRATHPRVVKTQQGFLVVWTESNGNQQNLATQIL